MVPVLNVYSEKTVEECLKINEHQLVVKPFQLISSSQQRDQQQVKTCPPKN